jgi:dUTP pyrophosphatase
MSKQLSVKLPDDMFKKIEQSQGQNITDKVINIFDKYFYKNEMNYKGEIQPTVGTPESAGIDLYLPKDVIINKGVNLIDLEISFEIPVNCFGFLTLRSSMTRDYGVLPVTGIIDSDYRGNIKVGIFNPSKKFELSAGKRIAQMIILPYVKITNFINKQELSETERKGGFGSTGV